MRTLTLTTLGFIVMSILSPKPIQSDTSTIPYYMYNAATEFNIDVALMYAICEVESNCRTKAVNGDDGTGAEKAAGLKVPSYGLFQIKAATAEGLGFITREVATVVRRRKGKLIKQKIIIDRTKDLLKPEINTWYAAKLLRHLYDRHNDTIKVISAYNNGTYTTANKGYVNKVLAAYARYKVDRKY